jgi:hypothetical protein
LIIQTYFVIMHARGTLPRKGGCLENKNFGGERTA